MANKKQDDREFMAVAESVAKRSRSLRMKVGAVIVQNNAIIESGFNYNPFRLEPCEYVLLPDQRLCFDTVSELEDYVRANPTAKLVTFPHVIHAEAKAIMRANFLCDGATIYVTHMPCIECAKLIWQSGIKRVVYKHVYRDSSGVEFLDSLGVTVEQLFDV